MDAQSLFSGGNADSLSKNNESSNRRMAVGHGLAYKPLIYGLEEEFDLIYSNCSERGHLAKQGSVDFCFIPTLEFAKLKGGWKVIPDVALATTRASHNLKLFFNKNLHSLQKITYHEQSCVGLTALKIILSERYQIDCEFELQTGPLDKMLQKSDAVLLRGERALLEKSPAFLDIDEEWFELTGLPLVYGFWIANELILKPTDAMVLQNCVKEGLANLEKIVSDEKESSDSKTGLSFLKSFSYTMGEAEKEGLAEIYDYAFFYGLTDYIPQFNLVDP